ncbi:beta-phosphoglucomutase [Paenibacillus guangzhouensis]|uniref:beta-phosphoglucomutase n=1 Tax=Paenibacillus guangzhouensis TaxID=1473112 RepID=UPI00126769AA|nr:beta-phosphoglucomutase [Paenibacillus guangzhouensis]
MEIRAVLFDLDGVITDTAEYHYVAWKQLAAQLGIEIDEAFNEQLKGVSRMESLERILRHGNRANDLSAEEKLALATQKNDEYVKLLVNVSPKDVYPGIRELLLELRAADIRTVIASASKNAPQILNSLALTDLFDYIVNPDEVPHGKPAPDIFLRGAEAVGVDPAFCVGIEDAQAGVEAIKSAKMVAVGIGEEHVLKPSGADVVLPSTGSLTWSFLQTLGE